MRLTKFLSAYRITHRLPGRIRIHIPALGKLPEEWQIYLEPATDLINTRNGINTVKIQPVTGNLLITFDPGKIKEAEIIQWLKSLVTAFLKQEIKSKPFTNANIRLRLERLHDRLSGNSTMRDIN
jgi:hypothetical protein